MITNRSSFKDGLVCIDVCIDGVLALLLWDKSGRRLVLRVLST